jgi:hypothetical protein
VFFGACGTKKHFFTPIYGEDTIYSHPRPVIGRYTNLLKMLEVLVQPGIAGKELIRRKSA